MIDITREEAIEELEHYLQYGDSDSYTKFDKALVKGLEALKNKKMGHWIDKCGAWSECYECSNCGCELTGDQVYILKSYCPSCGAKMERRINNDRRI